MREEIAGGQDGREVLSQQTSVKLDFGGVDHSLKQDKTKQ